MTHPDPPSDHDLVESARGGDRRALGALLERHQGRILRFAMKMCAHPEDARDVLQETLIAAARTLGDYRGDASVSTWLWTIARSFCIKQRRRSKFAPAPDESLDTGRAGEPVELHDPGRSPEEHTLGREIEAGLDEAISALEPGNREVLLLRDVEGLTAPEVAAVLGISTLAVKSRLHRARVAVREHMLPILGGERLPAPGPACPDVVEMLSRHLEDEISADTCAEMERHLAGCPACAAACDSLKQVLGMCRSTASAPVPKELEARVRTALRDWVDLNSTP